MRVPAVSNQKGVASLLATTIAGFLIAVIVLALSSMMVGELSQAIDAENTTKAYYASESGAEEAITAIKTNLANPANSIKNTDQNCSQPDNVAGATVPGITCRQIQSECDSLENCPVQSVAQDIGDQFWLASNAVRLTIDWDTSPPEPDKPFTTPGTASSSWPQDTPPAMEITAVPYQNGAPAAGGTGLNKLLWPCYNCGQTSMNYLTQPLGLTYTYCISPRGSGGFRCSLTIANIKTSGADSLVWRMFPRYTGSKFLLHAYDGSGNEVPVLYSRAQVDVTAKVGDSYRRITESVPVRSSPLGGFNNAISGDTDVCKLFNVYYDNTGGYDIQRLGCSYP